MKGKSETCPLEISVMKTAWQPTRGKGVPNPGKTNELDYFSLKLKQKGRIPTGPKKTQAQRVFLKGGGTKNPKTKLLNNKSKEHHKSVPSKKLTGFLPPQ